jgi:DNA-binding transcriptional LysR family regulator
MPCAISHRMKLLESILDIPLFDDEYSLSIEGQLNLVNVQASLKLLSENVIQSELEDYFVFTSLNQILYCFEHT